MTENQKPQTLDQINLKESDRVSTGFSEFDNVLGGGIVPGSVTLIAGDPGIGKSTLLLQLALNISSSQKTQNTQIVRQSESQTIRKSDSPSFPSIPNKVLYISGEESVEQIKIRANRIKYNKTNRNMLLQNLTNTNQIVDLIEQERPSLCIIDSIQTMESESLEGMSGSVSQIRYGTTQFIRIAKQLAIPIILVGHVTKEGMVAGPMILSHMVDAVLFMEGEKITSTRLLRSFKNRFGPVDEVGVFDMREEGLFEITNPEELFLTKRENPVPGSVLTVVMEGTRPFLIEIQALVVSSKLPMPRRVANGIDHKRLELLLAVLQKHCKVNADYTDVFINIAGGLRTKDPGIDLAICLAIYSSLKNIPSSRIVGIGEVGLLGELRSTTGLEKKIREAKKLGFKNIISAKTHKTLIQSLGSLV